MPVEHENPSPPDAHQAGSGPGRQGSGRPDALDRVLASPFVGFAPWVVLAVLEGPGTVVLAAAVALGLSVVVLAGDLARRRSIKILAVVDVLAFAGFLLFGLLASPPVLAWLEIWFGELANLVLVVVVAGSMLARVPFTIQYAQEETPREYWNTPTFRRINYVITGVWGLAFLVSSAAGFYGDAVLHDSDNLWTGWLIQIGATLAAVRFTQWYPEHATARAEGPATDPPPAPAG